jgi:hypothetical protein
VVLTTPLAPKKKREICIVQQAIFQKHILCSTRMGDLTPNQKTTGGLSDRSILNGDFIDRFSSTENDSFAI